MTEEKKNENEGPAAKPEMNHRNENFRGGRGRFNRFGGPRHQRDREERPRPLEQNPDEFEIRGNDDHPETMPFRGRRGGGRGGRSGGLGGIKEKDENARAHRNDDRVNDKLSTMGGNTYELPQKDNTEKKFSSRCRLYVGNLVEVTDEEVKEMFKKYGEVNECFVNREKMFAFVRLDYRANAERAKRELDGSLRRNKPLRVRFAPVGAAIKVKNLTQWVTNELLEYAFSVFGEIENAQVLVDERGNSLKEGIVEFARKPMALLALRRCSEGCFFITSALRPVVVEPYDVIDDVDGFPEKSITRKPNDYMKSREVGPRFAGPGTFEYEYGTRWKQLYDLYKQKEEALKRELKLEEEKLEAQMEYAKFEHETEMLREKLRQREQDRERQKIEWEMKERQAEEQRSHQEELLRRHQEELNVRMHHQEDDLRRRQKENSLFIQAQQMNNRMDIDRNIPPGGFEQGMPNMPGEPNLFVERNNRFDGRNDGEHPRGSRWARGHPNQEDFPNKRRRF